MSEPSPERFTILLGGVLRAIEPIHALIEGRRCIAADGGIAHARALGCEPELWVGDFDSATADDRGRYAHIPKLPFDTAKAATDGALAINEARDRGATDLLLVGAFGGRLDHTFAVMAQAVAAHTQGLRVLLTDGVQFAVPLRSTPETLPIASGSTFSVLAFGAMRGLSLRNARWPLDSLVVPFGDTLTVSNEARGPVTASLDEGQALLIWGMDED